MAKNPTKKTVTKPTTTKKATAKSPAAKAPVKKVSAKKAPAKKTPAKKAPAKKAPAGKTMPVRKPASASTPAANKSSRKPAKPETKASPGKATSKTKAAAPADPVKKKARKAVTTGTSTATVKKSISSTTQTPSADATETLRRPSATKKKLRSKAIRRTTAFTLEEVQRIAKTNALEAEKNMPASEAAKAAAAKKAADLAEVQQERRVHTAASLADILGFNPTGSNPREAEEKTVPKKHIRYYRLLIELRDHVTSEISLHTEDTLKRSSKDETGDLSSYSQHIADAGTDTFDRDFALSLVSNEQEALYEIEEALKRIKTGSYGVCELTGKPIAKDRLLAVPFARYSVESQAQMEKTKRRTVQRGGIFADANDADASAFIRDDSDE